MDNQQLEDQLTPEELESRRDEMKEFYEKSLPYLKSQAEYEKLLTEVEESRFKRANMQIQYANMMAAVQGPEESDEQLTPSHPKPETKAPTGKSKKLRKE
jgi:hypothetical protein